ncbi:MAG: serine/threonine protein kinase, partial [Methylococcales bacterium]|nr:serine/threonine protein kinase [Methylococcales bacterium]
MTEINQKLEAGVVLDHYVVNGFLGSGGFSNVYRAQSMLDEDCVVIKEYMPRKMTVRAENGNIQIRNEKKDSFERGKQLFLLEAKILADMKHENIVEALSCFHANNTVYLVMRYERGENLGAYVRKHGHLSEKFVDTVFPLVIQALSEVHHKGVLHLDIKPENIHIRPGGRPIILDFGAVHLFKKEQTAFYGRVLSKGFSAIEQYQKGSHLGPWSDVYALG